MSHIYQVETQDDPHGTLYTSLRRAYRDIVKQYGEPSRTLRDIRVGIAENDYANVIAPDGTMITIWDRLTR